MFVIKCFLTLILVKLAFDEISGQLQAGIDDISQLCIGCICDAASQCNRSVGCKNGVCGPFRFTNEYWLDAHQPVIDGDNPESEDAWVRCAFNVYCAAKAVKNYLERYRQDCNNDSVIDCADYAWIHHLGGFGCGSRPVNSLYEQQLRDCLVS